MSNQPLVLTRKVSRVEKESYLILALSAENRTKLRGRRTTICGQQVILQLPRSGFLFPGEVLAGDNKSYKVVVEAAMEELIQVEAQSSLQLMKAAFHLGNRHVGLEINENKLFLLKDKVIEGLLSKMGLIITSIEKPFFPENGAYSNSHKHYTHQ